LARTSQGVIRTIRTSASGVVLRAVIAALVEAGLSFREIKQVTGIPRTTAQRWAIPPKRAESA